MNALSPRRFPDTIVRRRQGPGGRNRFGEFEPGATVETLLRASVQPLDLEDRDISGEGARLVERLKVYVLAGVEYVVGAADSFTWNGDALTWGGDALTWGGAARFDPTDPPMLAAAFEDREADEVEYGGRTFTVVESRAWPTHTRATLLRET